jgi:alpha-mannosidase
MLRLLTALLSATTAHAWWKDEDIHTRGPAPYPYPATHKDGTAPEYKVVNEKTGPQEGKINVHLVPHTHDDTGWQVTVDQYFFTEVYYVVDTVVDQLVKNPNRHFIYVVRR